YKILPNSFNLSPISPNCHFFKHLNTFLANKLFRHGDTVKVTFKGFLNSKISDFDKFGIMKLVNRWEKCIESCGNYFD
ncbi:Histone-lysine N-methyltransferase SETMAR, partial [Habropoda laboriosa]